MGACHTCSVCLAVASSFAVVGHGVKLETHSQRLAESQSQAEKLCTKDVVIEGCDVLNDFLVLPGAKHELAAKPQLANVLVAEPSEVDYFLEDLGYPRDEKSFFCQDLCEKMVSRISTNLGVVAPSEPGVGCVDSLCEEQVGISKESLVSRGIQFPDAAEEGGSHTVDNKSFAGETPHVPKPVQRRILFRSALNIIFGIFPAIPASEHGRMNASATTQATSADGLTVGRSTMPERYHHHRNVILTASAWIAIAARRLSPGRSYVERWFLTKNKEVSKTLGLIRMVLTRMLHIISYLHIEDLFGDPRCENTAAFVEARPDCDVYSVQDCGRKTEPDGRFIVNTCEAFWKLGFAKHVGTIVHEVAHHTGAEDNAYCSSGNDCQKLPHVKAMSNADTYAALVGTLVADKSLNVQCNTQCNAVSFQGRKFGVRLPNATCGECFLYSQSWLSKNTCAERGITVARGYLTSSSICCIPHQCSQEKEEEEVDEC
eukprot:TRINITY_DN41146_c0_g1_i2.p1 TRINITY_DN41146_c0_g1~~TRINITY_DN41146_c0_g1_i2.p1  ORF type:complete len:487 (+),score=24.83 TRINITY_DN41146_c0_g1_i2:52-1512(+)